MVNALVVAAILTLFSCSQPKTEKYIGLQLYSLRDTIKKDLNGTIKNVSEIGYKFVEAAGYRDGKFYGMDPIAFKNLVNENGMDFLSSHTGHDVPDSANWDETMNWWDACIEAHSRAGVKYIVQPWMGKSGYASLDGLEKYCEYFNTVGEKCAEKGIKFGYHNHTHEFDSLENEIIYDFMLTHTDPDKVLYQMDLYWVVEGGANPVDYFNKYPGRFELWHVKDEAEVGASGKMDFKTIYENVEISGMKYQVVEVEEYNFDPLVSVQKSLEFLNNAEYVK